MATRKRGTARTQGAGRARAAGGNPATAAAAQDLAETHRRARSATTPIAKASTRQVLESKLATYTPEAARQAAGLVKQGSQPASTPKRRGTRSSKRK